MKILVTGGAGFIGSNFVRYMLETTDASIVNFDALTYAGNLNNLKDLESESRYSFVHGDITDRKKVMEVVGSGIDVIVNFAAESHVDRSILDSGTFVRTNVSGTQVLLEAARLSGIDRFVQISTDEVYGSLGPGGFFTEATRLAPNSPYSASKAAADLLVRAYFQTHKLDAVVTRCSNNYGPFQFPEKFIPLMILNAQEGRPVPVYGDGLNVRDWIHVNDHCEAVRAVVEKGRSGSIYNIGARNEWTNLDVVKKILDILGQPESLIEFVTDRPGHDRRYAIDSDLVESELNWSPSTGFDEGLKSTIEWYQNNGEWVADVRSGEYQQYYEKMYDQRDRTLQDL